MDFAMNIIEDGTCGRIQVLPLGNGVKLKCCGDVPGGVSRKRKRSRD